jgi:hypothetical protein
MPVTDCTVIVYLYIVSTKHLPLVHFAKKTYFFRWENIAQANSCLLFAAGLQQLTAGSSPFPGDPGPLRPALLYCMRLKITSADTTWHDVIYKSWLLHKD